MLARRSVSEGKSHGSLISINDSQTSKGSTVDQTVSSLCSLTYIPVGSESELLRKMVALK